MLQQQRKMIAQAICVKRSFILGIGAILVVYLTACCAIYFRNIDTFITRSFFRSAFPSSDASLSASSSSSIPLSEEEEKLRIRAELGHGVWNMLHRMAAQYDKNPTQQQQNDMVHFFSLLGTFYPCTECAAHFREMLKEHPVEAQDNRQLSLWLCRVHNIVNNRLGKPQFQCTLEALKERYGSCGCFDNEEEKEEGEEGSSSTPLTEEEKTSKTTEENTSSSKRNSIEKKKVRAGTTTDTKNKLRKAWNT